MRKSSNLKLLNHYILKHNIEDILDREILEYAQLHIYQKDEMILKAENTLEYYYLIADGKIKISYLFENGKSMLLKFYQDFNSIGDVELLKNVPILCDIEAIKDTYLIAIPAEILRTKFMSNLKFLHHLINCLSEKLYVTVNNSSYNFVYPLINRLSSYLMEHKIEKNDIVLNSTYKDISEFLGTTYRHLNRTFKEMEEEGIIKVNKKTVHILNEDKLRELSKNVYIKVL